MNSKTLPHNPDLGLFLMRLVLGIVFLVHGWLKWTNMAATVDFFGTLGLPAFMAYVIAAIELVGGIAVIVGFKTRVAAYLLAAVMVGAIVTVKMKMGLVGGYELELALFALALGVALSGPGKHSIEKK